MTAPTATEQQEKPEFTTNFKPGQYKFEMLAPSLITINHERYRQGLGEEKKKAEVAFNDLKNSIRRFGILQPIKISRDKELIAGYRRMTAALELGLRAVPVIYDDQDIPELTRREMELEENLHRHDMTWKERANAIADLHKLKIAADPSWGQEKTAQVAGTAQSKVSEALQLQNMLTMFPELAQAKTAKQALSIGKQKAKTVLRTEAIKSKPQDFKPIQERVICGDSTKLIKAIPDESFKLILTDPPFGIGYDRRKNHTGLTGTGYEDGIEGYESLLGMAPDLYRILEKDGFLIWFLGNSWLDDTLPEEDFPLEEVQQAIDYAYKGQIAIQRMAQLMQELIDWHGKIRQGAKRAFRKAGFIVDEIPLIWDRSEGRCYTTRPDRYFGRGYDIALMCIKGNPELVKRSRPQGNVFRFKPVAQDKKEHIVERPIELYEELIKHLTIQGERVVDFFAGSGSVGAAAARNNRDYLMIEKNPDNIPTIITKISNNTPGGGV